jgi:hypothetical protein
VEWTKKTRDDVETFLGNMIPNELSLVTPDSDIEDVVNALLKNFEKAHGRPLTHDHLKNEIQSELCLTQSDSELNTLTDKVLDYFKAINEGRRILWEEQYSK